MLETICEKEVVCLSDNGYATQVQEVNVIVNRSDRHSDNILRKCKCCGLLLSIDCDRLHKLMNSTASSNQPGSQITILTQPVRDIISQQVCMAIRKFIFHFHFHFLCYFV